MSDLVIALHGTRSRQGTHAAEELRRAVAGRLPDTEVVTGFVDVHDMRLADVVAAREDCVVVPAFLTAGYHVDNDIPAALGNAGGRAVATAHLGGELVGALADRLREAGGPGDAVVLASIGSSRPESNTEVHEVARALQQVIGVPVRVGFMYAATPRVTQALSRLRSEGYLRVSVAVHALAQGRYQEILDGLGADVVAGPIGVHPTLVDLIVSRYREALGSSRLSIHRRLAMPSSTSPSPKLKLVSGSVSDATGFGVLPNSSRSRRACSSVT